MSKNPDTIFALSSGNLPSGVAVIRISGNQAFEFAGRFLPNSKLDDLTKQKRLYSKIVDPFDQSIIDVGLVLPFISPSSFTGEDVVEFHLHGSVAVVERIFNMLENLGARPAEAGEFSKRAFENGLLDLTAIEGLSDLILAQTQEQRKLAISQHSGSFRQVLDIWRERLLKNRAYIEAELDFSDEEDVPDSLSAEVWNDCSTLADEISGLLDDGSHGEIIRSGFLVVIAGKPNVGKSSLLNALAKRDVAIVTEEAGTTRDLLEVRLNINGYLVILQDTAGLRNTENKAERIGVERSRLALKQAHLVLHLSRDESVLDEKVIAPMIEIHSKADLDGPDFNLSSDKISLSVMTGEGIDDLISEITQSIKKLSSITESPFITRSRHRYFLEKTVRHLRQINHIDTLNIDLRAEEMRLALDALGTLTGRVDVEDLLDSIFSEFCVGK